MCQRFEPFASGVTEASAIDDGELHSQQVEQNAHTDLRDFLARAFVYGRDRNKCCFFLFPCNVDPGLINPCLLTWGCTPAYFLWGCFSLVLVGIYHCWRGTPHRNKLGFVNPGSRLLWMESRSSWKWISPYEWDEPTNLCRTLWMFFREVIHEAVVLLEMQTGRVQ